MEINVIKIVQNIGKKIQESFFYDIPTDRLLIISPCEFNQVVPHPLKITCENFSEGKIKLEFYQIYVLLFGVTNTNI